MARADPRLRGEARQRERSGRAVATDALRRSPLRGAARGLREREPVVRDGCSASRRAIRRSAISCSGSRRSSTTGRSSPTPISSTSTTRRRIRDELREVAIAAATIYDRRLDDIEHAYQAYRRALAIEVEDAIPNERELMRRLEDLLGRAQKPAELVAVYDDVIARADDDLRREALIKRARVLEEGLGDATRAIESWREVVIVTEDVAGADRRALVSRGGHRARAAVPLAEPVARARRSSRGPPRARAGESGNDERERGAARSGSPRSTRPSSRTCRRRSISTSR